jgi:putative transposase
MWDYASVAATFVTFCCSRRGDVLGSVIDGTVMLNHLGRRCSEALGSVLEHALASVDCSMVMPDHVHAVLLTTADGVDVRAIVGSVKAQVARKAGIAGLWWRSFYDHIVRGDADLDRISEYIATNPLRWSIAVARAGQVPPLRNCERTARPRGAAGLEGRPQATGPAADVPPSERCEGVTGPALYANVSVRSCRGSGGIGRQQATAHWRGGATFRTVRGRDRSRRDASVGVGPCRGSGGIRRPQAPPLPRTAGLP